MSDKIITTSQAAQALGVSRRRVLALIRAGRLRATRYGRDWLIDPHDLDPVRIRKPGRPAARDARMSGRKEGSP